MRRVYNKAMAQIYTNSQGIQVYDFNGQTYNAKTGQVISGTQVAPSATAGIGSMAYGAVNTNPSPIPTSVSSPISKQSLPVTTPTSTGGSSSTNTSTGNTGITPTGNANLDAALGPLATQITQLASNGQIPSTLEITPALVGTFLSWAHSVVDPQTQAALSAEATNVNNAISNAVTNYNNQQAESVQGFGMDLLNEQDSSGKNGTAFSGMRNLQENNMVNSENRTLSTNAANTALSLGNTLNTGAAAVGATNAGMFNLPSVAGAGTVSNQGGSTGSYTASAAPLSLGYNPSIYVAGSIPSSGATNVGNQEANYLGQYSTLAGNNSNGSRSVNDLLGMITGAPAGATSNLQ